VAYLKCVERAIWIEAQQHNIISVQQSFLSHFICSSRAIEDSNPHHMERLQELYAIPHEDSVFSFLEDYPHLEPILADAYEHLVKHFGTTLQQLELTFEVDEDTDEEYLLLLVKSSLDSRQALKVMDEFDDDWWLDVEENQIVIALDVPEAEVE
jgi:uncharacterized protein YuzE